MRWWSVLLIALAGAAVHVTAVHGQALRHAPSGLAARESSASPSKSESGSYLTPDIQESGTFKSMLWHIPRHAKAPDGQNKLVEAIRKVEPNAKITVWNIEDTNVFGVNDNFTYAFVSQGKGRFLLAWKNAFSNQPRADMTEVVKVGPAPKQDKPFDGGEIFTLSPVDPKTNKPIPRELYLSFIVKGPYVQYLAEADKFVNGTLIKSSFITFYGKTANMEPKHAFNAAINNHVQFSHDPPPGLR